MTPLSTSPPDLGSSVLFDHINMRVTDHRWATAFFLEGLGLTRDPYRQAGTGNMWVNIGTQQFHLPIGEPVAFAGEIGLVVPDLAATARALESVRPLLRDTRFDLRQEGAVWLVSDPWGRRLRLHGFGDLPGRFPLAIPYVEFLVPPGAAPGIQQFYRDILHAPATLEEGEAGRTATVVVGPHQQLRFRESSDGLQAAEALHVCLYLARFEESYGALQDLGALYREKADEQYRFREIRSAPQRVAQFSVEHEIRSLYHQDYARPLLNRYSMPGDPVPGRA